MRDNRDLAGGVTKDYLESLKTEVADLAAQLSRLLLEDLYAVTRTIEALHDHVRDMNVQVEALAGQADAARRRPGGAERDALVRIERVLVMLISTFPAGAAVLPGPEGPHEPLLMDKRREMLDQMFSQLRTGRPVSRTF